MTSSKRQFHWTTKVSNEDEEAEEVAAVVVPAGAADHHQEKEEEGVKAETEKKVPSSAFQNPRDEEEEVEEEASTKENKNSNNNTKNQQESARNAARKKMQAIAIARWKSILTAFGRHRAQYQQGLGTRVMGTLFGYRRGHVHFAIQKDPNSQPAFLIELATPITGLVKEMASGLVRIALECDKQDEKKKQQQQQSSRLLEEPIWRTYCNGKKCGFANRRECGAKELSILKAVEPISMGAGVLPAGNSEGCSESEGEIMYMRAKFERVVGSRDSEAFYMMNPDSNGAPELSIYLLRV